MAVLKLNNVTTITESSGALTLANAALGTPTSATLTNATFPDGHILQIQGNSGTAASSIGTGTIISQAITLIDFENNDVLITATGAFHKQSGDDAGHLGIYVVGGSLGSDYSDGQRYTAQALYNQANGHEETVAISHWDKTPDEAVCTYGIYLFSQGSIVLASVRFTINVMEIKR